MSLSAAVSAAPSFQELRQRACALAVAQDGRAAAAFYYGDPGATRDPAAHNVFASLYR
jgi:hypothetical protein